MNSILHLLTGGFVSLEGGDVSILPQTEQRVAGGRGYSYIMGHPRCSIIYSFSLFYGLLSGLHSLLRMFCLFCIYCEY